MIDVSELFKNLSNDSRTQFQEMSVVLSFGDYLERVRQHPERFMRNAAVYLRDVFDHFGSRDVICQGEKVKRWNLFDQGTDRGVAIIGNEFVQNEIYKSITQFARQGYINKLLLLHGPNGSAKSSIIDAIAAAMKKFSETEEGAVYRFNWIFPADKSGLPKSQGEAGPIGFGGRSGDSPGSQVATYAYLEEGKIASKIPSEFKDNPLFLIPMPLREKWLRVWLGATNGVDPEAVEIPSHMLLSGLSKRNQLIFENLMAAYDGDLVKVFRHVQVERYFFSKQYRVGIGTIEPQMAIDANERQLTADRNMANLPPILHNVSFFEAMGPLVDGNRGFVEFSDMLKRPLESFKYLLTTVEKGTLNLATSTANMDMVFFGSTNEKHLDAFKQAPDFASFKSRIDLVTAPYLLQPSEEERIYNADVDALSKIKPICPHTLRLLCIWAVMTRLRQPDADYYEGKFRPLITRLDPFTKIRLYENQSLAPVFKQQEENVFKEISLKIAEEYQNTLFYEGRFGASPRELRGILYRAVHNPAHETLTPMAVFDELEVLVKDRTVYEFLQIEPKGRYHQPGEFIKTVKREFLQTFEREVTTAMTLVEEEQYDIMLQRYVDNVVASVKREKIFNKATNSYEPPSETLMKEQETIFGITGAADRHRENILGRIAAWRLDHPNDKLEISKIFHDYLGMLHDHYYAERRMIVERNFQVMLALDTDSLSSFSDAEVKQARFTVEQLQKRFGYDPVSTRNSLRFLLLNKELLQQN